MDWDRVIERNREALRRVLAMLLAMAGPGCGGQFAFFPPEGGAASGPAGAEESRLSPALTLPRRLHRAILALLRPAEAAARRLVVVAAHGLVVTLPPPRKAGPRPRSIFVRDGKGTGVVLPRGVRPGDVLPDLAPPRAPRRGPCLPLLDPLPKSPAPRRPPAGGAPRISMPGVREPYPLAARRQPLPNDRIDARRLALRLLAVGRVLDDLPAHARRFARWRMRARAAVERMRRITPLRPGRPPGSRRKPTHEVHQVLKDLHYFAFYALEQPDSS